MGEEGAVERALAARGQAAAMAPATEGKTPLGPYHCENEGNSGRTGLRRSWRTRGRMKSENGGAMAELNAGGEATACGGVSSRSAFPNRKAARRIKWSGGGDGDRGAGLWRGERDYRGHRVTPVCHRQ
jgi:hypothetical protein